MGIKSTTYQRMFVEKIRYYLGEDAKPEDYLGARFEGSLDGTTWDTIYTIKQLPKEGWNSADDECNSFDFNFYAFVRFVPSPNHIGKCDLAELQIRGKEMFVEQREEFTCNAVLYAISRDGMEQVAKKDGVVVYSQEFTPKITDIDTRYVSWRGNDQITITGVGFPSNYNDVSVKIDGIACSVFDGDLTHVKCLTGERRELVSPSTFEVMVNGRGLAENRGHTVKYVCYFSDEDCWGDDYAPGPGDSLYVPPGLNLVIDVDEVPNMDNAEPEDLPYLTAVVVEGSLIFEPKKGDDTHQRTFSAGYMIVREGVLEIGTKDNPYTSNLDIILYGEKEDPQLPLFGNKVIGVWDGRIDIHGRRRSHTWLELAETAAKGAEKIKLNTSYASSDWHIGD